MHLHIRLIVLHVVIAPHGRRILALVVDAHNAKNPMRIRIPVEPDLIYPLEQVGRARVDFDVELGALTKLLGRKSHARHAQIHRTVGRTNGKQEPLPIDLRALFDVHIVVFVDYNHPPRVARVAVPRAGVRAIFK